MSRMVWLLPALLLAGVVQAQSLDPAEPALGESATLTLDAAPPDSLQAPIGVGVVVRPTGDPTVFELLPVRVGRVGVVPQPALADTLWWEVPGTIEQAAPERLRPLKSAGPVRPNWWPTMAIVLLVLAPIVFWIVRKMGSRAPRAGAFTIPFEPPHVTALARLDGILAAGWLEREEFDRFYVEVSHTLRSYIQGRYRVPVLDWTSGEIVDGLAVAGYEKETVNTVRPLLDEADHVKFARSRPTRHMAEQWLESTRAWILDTAVEPRFSTPEALRAAESLTGHAAGSRSVA